MAERKCSKCGAAAEPKLKFCRECGGLVDAPAAVPASEAPTGVVAPPPEAGDATMLASGSVPVPAPAPAAPPPAPAPGPTTPSPAAASRLAGAGDETIISGLAALRPKTPAKRPKSAKGGKVEKAADMEGGDRTMAHSGTIRTEAAPPPPPADDIEADLQKTFLGGTLPTPASVAAVPPPEPSAPGEAPTAAPPVPGLEVPRHPAPVPTVITPTDDADDEPVHDDLGVGDEGEEPAVPAPPPPRLQEARPTAPIPGLPPAGAPGAAIRLEHWSPRVKGDVVDVSAQETVVGRDKGDLKYPEDPFLSKKHARFFKDGEGRLCVEDLGGLNGTFVRLTAPAKLEHRDVLVVGRHVFRFELLQYEEQDDRTIEGDPLTRVQGVQGKAPRARIVKRQEEGFRGLPYYFGTNRYVIGRTDGTHNFQRDDRMSRRHAALQFREGDYWLEDLGSQNGTFLRIRGPRALDRGDVVMMGDQYFRLV